jgi:Glycosyl hydrolase family 20, catalytic domain
MQSRKIVVNDASDFYDLQKKLNIFHIDFNFVCLRTDFLRNWLKRIADMGFNAILWELEDKVRWETCPECVWPEALSKEEFRELLAYSKSLGLEPLPLLQTIGHAEYVLLQDKYKGFREVADKHSCYCTSNLEVSDFLIRWIKEYIELFGDIRFFHLGGDEAYEFGTCSQCAGIVEKYDKNKLYSNYINALAAPLLENNIRPGIWNDMIMHYPDSVNEISKDFVIWDWNYWDTDDTPKQVNVRNHGYLKKEELDDGLLKSLPELLDKDNLLQPFYSVKTLKKHGFDIILCSGASTGGDNFYCPSPIHAGNIVGAASTVISDDLLGNCVTSWAIRLNDFITQIPSIGLATLAMREPEKNSKTLQYEYCENLFGAKPDKFITASHLIGMSIPFAQSNSTFFQWDGTKGSLPAPSNYINKYLEGLEQENPDLLKSFTLTVNKGLVDLPQGIKLLSEYFQEAKRGLDIIEYWITGASFLLNRALIAQKILNNDRLPEIVQLLEAGKNEYTAFLCRRETPKSAEKNAGLVFDPIIDYFLI